MSVAEYNVLAKEYTKGKFLTLEDFLSKLGSQGNFLGTFLNPSGNL